MYNILVCDDEKDIVSALEIYLTADGYQVFTAYNGREAVDILNKEEIHLVLMDIMMPEMNGISAMVKIREKSNVPVILLTAKSEDTDKIDALDAGADDYLTKPFSVEELLARLRVTQRRLDAQSGAVNADAVFTNGKLKVDYAAGCAFLDGKELHLTPSEYKLLCLLCRNVGKVLTHTFITQQIWGRSWENDIASLRVFMATLRKKLEQEPGSPQYIQTHIGVGYRMMKVE